MADVDVRSYFYLLRWVEADDSIPLTIRTQCPVHRCPLTDARCSAALVRGVSLRKI